MSHIFFCIRCGSKTTDGQSHVTNICPDCRGERTHERTKAISLVAKAVRCGDLPKQTDCQCADCGAKARAYDHRDYTKPLDVVPVCSKCNWLRGHALDSVMRVVPQFSRTTNKGMTKQARSRYEKVRNFATMYRGQFQ